MISLTSDGPGKSSLEKFPSWGGGEIKHLIWETRESMLAKVLQSQLTETNWRNLQKKKDQRYLLYEWYGINRIQKKG